MNFIKEAGRFAGLIVDHKIAVLNNEKQTPYLALMLDSDGEFAEQKLFLSPAALPYTVEKLQKLGFTGPDVVNLNVSSDSEVYPGDEDRNYSLRGVEVEFVVAEETNDKGDIFYNVKGVYPKGDTGGNKISPTPDALATISKASKQLLATK